jgi:glyoxylase-like metal-dependent hydrolase (beta-lactamase superfamily II)
MQKKHLSMDFLEEIAGIYRLRVPFERVYTSVFLLCDAQGAILVDCATTAEDVDGQIVPALQRMGLSPTDIFSLVLTHKHSDHAGGLSRFLEYAPKTEVITEVGALREHILTYPMAGHTEDAIGVLDLRSHTLISGDGLQGAGVDKYRCSLKDRQAYLETIARIRNDERIENLLFSHAYEPWYEDRAMGREAVARCLDDCIACMR